MYKIVDCEVLIGDNEKGFTHFCLVEKTEIELSDTISKVTYEWNEKTEQYEELERITLSDDNDVEIEHDGKIYKKVNESWQDYSEMQEELNNLKTNYLKLIEDANLLGETEEILKLQEEYVQKKATLESYNLISL